jgi:hypothetical protein
MSVNMAEFTAPKTDQLNADSLIGGPVTVTITGVRANEGAPEQPVSISYDGDDGKPYKPCKSMRRVMVQVWGADAKQYVGRSMTLYCDPEVQFGGMKVGGIRISHMSHIDKPVTMALTATKAKRKPYTVQPLASQAPAVDVLALIDQFKNAATQADFDAAELARGAVWRTIDKASKELLKAASDAAKAALAAKSPEPEPTP